MHSFLGFYGLAFTCGIIEKRQRKRRAMKMVERPRGYKPFDKELYKGHNWVEEYTIKTLRLKLNDAGLELCKNPDPFGIDILVIYKNEIIGGIEAEWHGKYWKKNRFPFNTVHFLGRKKKYITKGAFYIMTNNDAKNALMIGFDELQHHGTKIMNNELCTDEPIWDVPNDNCIWGWYEIIETLLAYYIPIMVTQLDKI